MARSCPLFRTPDPSRFTTSITRLHQRWRVYTVTSPVPLPAADLLVTPEIRCQSELYLPITGIRKVFHRFYRQSLTYPPVLSSTPFAGAISWADLYTRLPGWLQTKPDPSVFLETLLADHDLRSRFLFYSFLPERHNGCGFRRYPKQAAWLSGLLVKWRDSGKTGLCCIDAACGSGEGTWELAEMLAAAGWQPEQAAVAGWTLDPLEVHAATELCLPHHPERQLAYRRRTLPLLYGGWRSQVDFSVVDLCAPTSLPVTPGKADLVVCNGLLGGPIIHDPRQIEQIVGRLAALLSPGGCLALADCFHGGWKKKTPKEFLEGLLEASGLQVVAAGEGSAGIRT